MQILAREKIVNHQRNDKKKVGIDIKKIFKKFIFNFKNWK